MTDLQLEHQWEMPLDGDDDMAIGEGQGQGAGQQGDAGMQVSGL